MLDKSKITKYCHSLILCLAICIIIVIIIIACGSPNNFWFVSIKNTDIGETFYITCFGYGVTGDNRIVKIS